MSRLADVLMIAIIGTLVWLAFQGRPDVPHRDPHSPQPIIIPAPYPVPDNRRPPYRPWYPWRELGATVAGGKGPDGTEIACDLPDAQQQKNISAKGLGCCVFRSLDHASRFQNVPALQHFPEWMVSKGIEGGGYPGKVDKLIPQIAADRKLPVPQYVQSEGMDLDLLCTACASGRMPCITYSKSPTGRYGGARIAHMVNIVYADQKANGGKGWFVVLDNNYIGETNYEWMTTAEFKAAYAPGWCVILLSPPPPMPPRN